MLNTQDGCRKLDSKWPKQAPISFYLHKHICKCTKGTQIVQAEVRCLYWESNFSIHFFHKILREALQMIAFYFERIQWKILVESKHSTNSYKCQWATLYERAMNSTMIRKQPLASWNWVFRILHIMTNAYSSANKNTLSKKPCKIFCHQW